MKRQIRLFTTVMMCMAMVLCVSCKKNDDCSDGGSIGGGNTYGGGTGDHDHEYVDLGLPSGLLWATCNVGADSPEDYGNYYAWGEMTTKSCYNWNTYKWCNGSYDKLTKYCTYSDYGTADNKTVLDPEDDVACVNWGGSWRMPTRDELQELKDNCRWTWTTQGGKEGYRVAGFNGNSIFLPAAGYRFDTHLNSAGSHGFYWSSSLYSSNPNHAYSMYFHSGSVNPQGVYPRFRGYTVRPVW